jgi:predicted ester cyclase
MLLTALPDMRMDVEDLIAGEDKTVARVKATATHGGEFMWVPPTGTRVEMQLIDIMRFDDAALLCEHWGVTTCCRSCGSSELCPLHERITIDRRTTWPSK